MNSSNFLARNADKYPNVYAVKSEYGDLTYLELNEQVNRLSHALLQRNIQKIDKVILFMPNTLEFIISYFAIQRIGAIAVPINIQSTKNGINYILNDSKPKAIIAHNLVYNTLRDLDIHLVKIKTGKGNLNWESFLEVTSSASSKEVNCLANEDDLSSLLYTLDVNNDLKRILFSYRNIILVSQIICAEMEVKQESRILLMLAFNHSVPFHLFLTAGIIAGSTFILRANYSVDLIIEAIESEQTTHFLGNLEVYLELAKKIKNKEADLSPVFWWVYDDTFITKEDTDFIKGRLKTNNFVSINQITEDDS